MAMLSLQLVPLTHCKLNLSHFSCFNENNFYFIFIFQFARFGCKIISPQTGIILNDGMDDFSVPGKKNAYGIPPSPANFIRPKKMPLSSMCPSILLDKNGDVEVVLGGAGGSKITSSVAYVRIYKHSLFFHILMFVITLGVAAIFVF